MHNCQQQQHMQCCQQSWSWACPPQQRLQDPTMLSTHLPSPPDLRRPCCRPRVLAVKLTPDAVALLPAGAAVIQQSHQQLPRSCE